MRFIRIQQGGTPEQHGNRLSFVKRKQDEFQNLPGGSEIRKKLHNVIARRIQKKIQKQNRHGVYHSSKAAENRRKADKTSAVYDLVHGVMFIPHCRQLQDCQISHLSYIEHLD